MENHVPRPENPQQLPLSTPDAHAGVPVFDCHVILTPPSAPDNGWHARTANLPGMTATGSTERDVLLAIVALFKKFVSDYHERAEPIPWQGEPEKPESDEQERWIPVHL